MTPGLVPVAVRAYTERTDQPARTGSPLPWKSYPVDVLVIDTETTNDELQRLKFGSWRHCKLQPDASLRCVEEGLFYEDDLPTTNPAGFKVLEKYVRTEKPETTDGRGELLFMPKSEFLSEVFFRTGYQCRAFIVGFSLPFDLTRLASSWGEGRAAHYGWFSLAIWQAWNAEKEELIEHPWRPRIEFKKLDTKGAFIEFANAVGADPVSADVVEERGRKTFNSFRGNFLDLHTLAFALTGESYSLAAACKAFRVEHGKIATQDHGRITRDYIDYNRRDVLATKELFERLLTEFDTHPIGLNPCKAFSSASIAKAYMRALGVNLPSKQFADIPKELLGIAMCAYYGGRAESHIRKSPVPIVHTDFLSMYPTLYTLMEVWKAMTSERLVMEEWTEKAQCQLDSASPDTYYDPASWPLLMWFGEVEPSGDILPLRAQYNPANPALNIAISQVTSVQPLWYAGPDLVASALLSGRAPRLKRAFRLVPKGRQTGLKPVMFSGTLPIDPASQDFIKTLIEQRKRVQKDPNLSPAVRERIARALKLVANSVGYGVSAEIYQERLPKEKEATIRVFVAGSSFETTTRAPETAGDFCFPPFAALITAGARLMLALLERSVTDVGGTWAFCDTDSMAVVATKHGGFIPVEGGPVRNRTEKRGVKALSWAQVETIIARFANLNPYDQSAIPGSILEIKDVNYLADGKQAQLYVYSIAAKRYAFFRKSRGKKVEIVQASEHGLGHLLNPLPNSPPGRWIELVWEYMIADALSWSTPKLDLLDLPALTRISVSSPHIQRPFTEAQRELPFKERIRPSTFLLSASVARNGHPVGANPLRFHLVAPYESDRTKWLTMKWTDIHTGHQYDVTTEFPAPPYVARIRSYRDVLDEYKSHPEPKSAGTNGKPCGRATRGLLQRRKVGIETLVFTGKETNQLEAVDQGLIHDWNEVYSIYRNPELDPWRTEVIPILKTIPARILAEAAQVSQRTIRSIRNGNSVPSAKTRALLLEIAEITRKNTSRTQGKRLSNTKKHTLNHQKTVKKPKKSLFIAVKTAHHPTKHRGHATKHA